MFALQLWLRLRSGVSFVYFKCQSLEQNYNQSCQQCDHNTLFLKVLVVKYFYESSPNFWQPLGPF